MRNTYLENEIASDLHDYKVAELFGDDTTALFRCPADPLNASPYYYEDTEKSPLSITYPAFLTNPRNHYHIGLAYRAAMTGLRPVEMLRSDYFSPNSVYAKVSQILVFETLKPQFIGHFSEDEFFTTYRVYVLENVLDLMERCHIWADCFRKVLKTLPYYDDVLMLLQDKALYRITPLNTKYRHTHTLQRDFTKLGNVLYPAATKVILDQNTHKSETIADHTDIMDNLPEMDAAAYAQYYR